MAHTNKNKFTPGTDQLLFTDQGGQGTGGFQVGGGNQGTGGFQVGGDQGGFDFSAFANQQRNAFSSQQAQLGQSNVQSIVEQLASSGQLTPGALALLNQRSQRQQAGGLQQFNAALSQQGLQESQFSRGQAQQQGQFDISSRNQLIDIFSQLDPTQQDSFVEFLQDFGVDLSGGIGEGEVATGAGAAWRAFLRSLPPSIARLLPDEPPSGVEG